MPEQNGNNHKERVFGGETPDTQDQAGIEAVRSELLEHVRLCKGLPAVPHQLDVKVISQLSDANIIDGEQPNRPGSDPQIIDISKLPPNYSAVGRAIRARRLIRLKRAA